VRILVYIVRLVGRERKNNILVDRSGVEYNIIDKALFAKTKFREELKGIEDIRIDLLTCLLPLDLGLINSIIASLMMDNVQVVLRS
jgi:hypothetical protein